MKLHLPSGLRKALLACLAALAMPAFTVSSGAAVFGGVAFSFLTGQRAVGQEPDALPDAALVAEDEDDEEDSLSLYSDNEGIMPIAFTGFEPEGGWGNMVAWAADADGAMTLSGTTMWVDVSAMSQDAAATFTGSATNLRLEFNGGPDSTDPAASIKGRLDVENIWFTGTNGRARVNDNDLLTSTIQNIYVNNVQLWFTGTNYTAERALEANFILGPCVYHEGLASLDYAALRMGGNVTTNGDLILVDDVRIGFQGSNTFSVGGAVSGSGYRLTITRHDGSNNLIFSGGGTLGSIEVAANVKLTIGGEFTLEESSTLNGAFELSTDATLALGARTTFTLAGGAVINGRMNRGTDHFNNIIVSGTLSGSGEVYLDQSTDNVIESLDFGGKLAIQSATVTLTNGGTLGTLKLDGYSSAGVSNIIKLGGDLSVTNIEFSSASINHRFENATADGHMVYLSLQNTTLLNNEHSVFGDNVGVKLNIAETATISRAVSISGDVKLLGGGTLTFGSGSSSLGSFSAESGSLSVASGAGLSLGSFSGSLTSLTINDGGTLALGSGQFAVGTFTGDGRLKLSALDAANALINITGSASGSLTLDLSELLDDGLQAGTYSIFAGISDWTNLSVDIINWSHLYDFSFENGSLIVSEKSQPLGTDFVFDEADEAFDWGIDGGSNVWDDELQLVNGAWINNSNAEFAGTAEGGIDVTLVTDVVVNNMTVTQGSYTFSGDHQITINGYLTLNDNTSATFNQQLNLTGALTINDGATLTYNGDGSRAFSAGSITINSGGVLFLNGASSVGTVSGEGALRLKSDKNERWHLHLAGGQVGEIQVRDDNGGGIQMSIEGSLRAGDWRLTKTDGGNSTSGWSDIELIHLLNGADLELTAATFGGYNAARTIYVDATGESSFIITPASGVISLRSSLHTGSSVTLVKRGSGMLALGGNDDESGESNGTNSYHLIEGSVQVEEGNFRINSAARIKGGVYVADGATLSFWKNFNSNITTKERVIEGLLSGAGTLRFINEELVLQSGGSIGSVISGWANSSLTLGGDLFVGSNLGAEGGNADITIRKWSEANVDAVTVYLNITSDANLSNRYVFEDGVTLAKRGSARLIIGSGSNGKIRGGFVVEEGELYLNGTTMTISSVTGTGGVFWVEGGTNTINSIDFDGTVHAFGDDLQLTFANGGRIGTFVNAWGTGHSVKLGADLTIEGAAKHSNKSNGAFAVVEGSTASLVFDTRRASIDIHDYEWTYSGIGLGVKGGNTLTMNGGTFTTINVTGGSTLALSTALTAGSLSISESSRIELGANTLTINGALTASGNSTLAVSRGGHISGLTGLTVTDSGKLNITLSDFVLADFLGSGYELFQGGSFEASLWNSINLNLGLDGIDAYDIVYEGGTIKLQTKVYDALYWVSEDGRWTAGEEDLDWAGQETGDPSLAFDSEKKVIFGAHGEGAAKNVTLDESISTKAVLVVGSYTFNLGDYTLTIGEGGLTLGNGSSLGLMGNATTVNSSVMLEGDAALTLGNGARLTLNRLTLGTHTLTLWGAGTLQAAGEGSSLTIDDGTLKLTQTVHIGSDVVLGSGATLITRQNATDAAVVEGCVTINEGATLQVDGGSLTIGSFESNASGTNDKGLRIFGSGGNERTLTVQGTSRLNGNLHIAYSGALELQADLIVGNSASFTTGGDTDGIVSSIKGGEGVFILFDGLGSSDGRVVVGGDLESWLTASSGSKFGTFSSIDDDIGYGFTGGGIINLKTANNTSTDGNVTLTRAFKVDTDTTVVLFDGTWDMKSFAGEGTIIIQSAHTNGNSQTVTLHEGGSIGTLAFNQWGGRLDIEDSSLTIHALSTNYNDHQLDGANGRVRELSGGGTLTIDSVGEATAKHVTFNAGLTVIKQGAGTQNLADTTLNANLQVTAGSLVFTEGTTGSGNVTVNGGSVSFAGATNISGTVTVSSQNALTWEHRDGNHHTFDTDWESALSEFVHFGTLSVQATGTYNIYRNLTLDSLTWGESVTEIGIRDLGGSGINPFVSVDEALSGSGALTVMNGVLLLKHGGSVSGRLTLGWGGGLILGDDLEVGEVAYSTNKTTTFKSFDEEDHYLVWRHTDTAAAKEFAISEFNSTTWDHIGVKKTGAGEVIFTGGGTLNTFVNVAEGTLTLAGNTTVNGAFTLGATLKLNSGVTLSVQSLTLGQGAALALSSLDASSAAITLSGDSAALSGSLTLDLTGWTELGNLLDAAGDSLSFALFSNFSSYEDLTLTLKDFAFAGWEYELDASGNLVFTKQTDPDTLYWMSTDGKWSADEDSLDWASTADGSAAFAYSADKNVVFGANEEHEAITVTGVLSVLSATVSGDYAFNLGEDTSLSIGEDGLTIDAGATLELSSSGTLSIDGDVNLNGTLLLNIANSGAGTTLWNAENNIVAGDDALIVLNFANGNAERTSINTFIGTAYTGAVELRGGSLFGTDANTPSYSSITVTEGAQLALGADYAGTIHISGFGATSGLTSGGHGQMGALRLDRWVDNSASSYTFSGDLYLDAAAAVTSYENNTTGTISGAIHGGDNVLFVFGGTGTSKVTLSGEITELAGLWSKNINLGTNTTGANVDVTGSLSIVAVAEGYGEEASRFSTELTGVEGSFVFGVENAGRTMTLTSTSSLSGSADIVKVGAGKLVLGGSVEDYTGALTIEAGTVEVNSADSATIANTTVVGGTLSIGADVESLSGNVTLSKGTAESATPGSLSWAASTLSIGGTLTVAQGGALTVAEGKTLNVEVLSSLGSLTVDAGGTLSATRGNISGTLTLNGTLSLGEITNRGDGLLLSASSINFGTAGSLTLDLTGFGNGDYKLFNFADDTYADWNDAWDALITFDGLEEGTYNFEDGVLHITGVLENIFLDNGDDRELAADADGNGGALGSIIVTNTEELETHESVINVASGDWTVKTIMVASGATLTLDGAADHGDTWAGGTLSLTGNGQITNDGTLVIKGRGKSAGFNGSGNNMHKGFDTVFGSDVTLTIGGSGTVVLDFDTTGYRVSLADVLGSSYKNLAGSVVLRNGFFASENITTAGQGYRQLTVEDGAQLIFSGTSYNGLVHIAGWGVQLTGNDACYGALRLDNTTLQGELHLDGDAAVYKFENNAGNIASHVYGHGHTLYKHGNYTLTFTNNAVLEGLAGIVTRKAENAQGSKLDYSGDGGNVTLNSGVQLIIDGDFVFGIEYNANNITLAEGASIVSATDEDEAAIPGAISKTGAGTLNLNGSLSGFTGTLEIEAGTVNLNNSDTETVFTEVILSGGTLALTKETVNIGGLGGESGSITAAAARKLVLNTAENHTTAVALNAAGDDGTAYITLTKQGAGKQTFSAEVALAALNMEGGTLALTGGGSTGNITFSGTSTLELGETGYTTTTLASGDDDATLTIDSGKLTLNGGSTSAGIGGTLNISEGATLKLITSDWQSFNGTVNVDGMLEISTGQFDARGELNVRNGGLQATDDGATLTISEGSTVNFLAATDENSTEWSTVNKLDMRAGALNIAGNLEVQDQGIVCGYGDPSDINVDEHGHLKLSSYNGGAKTWNGTVNVAGGGKLSVESGANQTISSLTFTGAGTVHVSGTEDATGTLSVTNAVSIADGASIILSEHSSFSAGGRLTIQSGGSLIMDGGSYDPANVTLQDGGMVKIVRGKTWTVSSLPWTATVDNLLAINPLDGSETTELATLVWESDTIKPGQHSTFGVGIALRTAFDEWNKSDWQDVDVQERVEIVRGELILAGWNTWYELGAAALEDGTISNAGKLVLRSSNGGGTIQDSFLTLGTRTVNDVEETGHASEFSGWIDMRDGTGNDHVKLTLKGDLTVLGGGIDSTGGATGGGAILSDNGSSLTVNTINNSAHNGADYIYKGYIDLGTGNFTKLGEGLQQVYGDITAAHVNVYEGTLRVGSDGTATSTITGNVEVGVTDDGFGRLEWTGELTITGDLAVAGGSIFDRVTFAGIEDSTEGAQNVLRIPDGLTVQGNLVFAVFSDGDWDWSHKVQIDGNFMLGTADDRHGVNVNDNLTLILSGTSGQTQTITGEVTGNGQLYLRGMGGNGTEPTLTVDLQSGGTLTGALVAGQTTLLIGNTLEVGGLRAVSEGEDFNRRDLTVGVSGNATGTPDFTLNVETHYGEGDATVYNGSLTLDGVRLVKTGSGNQVIGGAEDAGRGSASAAETRLNAENIQVNEGALIVAGQASITGSISIADGATMAFRQLSGGNRNVRGLVSGDGTLEVGEQLLQLQRGAQVGNLRIGNAAALALGADLTTGSLSWLGGEDAVSFSKSADSDYVTLNVTGNNYDDVVRLNLEAGVRFALADDVAQRVAGSAFADAVTLGAGAQLQVQGSELNGPVQLGRGAELLAAGTTTIAGNVSLGDQAALTVQSGDVVLSGTLSGAQGAINANGGTLTITGTAEANPFGGALNFAGGEVVLNRDLTVSDITITGVNNVLRGTGTLTIDTAVDNTLDVTNGRLTVSGVSLVKQGRSNYEIAGLVSSGSVTVAAGSLLLSGSEVAVGDLTVESGTRIQFAREGENKPKTTINGALAGAGDIVVAAGTLTVAGDGTVADNFTGRVSLRNNAALAIARDTVTIGGLSTTLDTDTDVSGELQKITGSGRLVLNVADGATVTQTLRITADAGVTIEKTGAGTQELMDFGAKTVQVTEGTLRLTPYSGSSVREFTSAIENLTVSGGSSVLEVQRRSWSSDATTITLADGGTMKTPLEPIAGQELSLRLGTLAVEGTGNSFSWGDNVKVGDEVKGQLLVHFNKLTGSGELVVGSFGSQALDTTSKRRRLSFGMVENFGGTLSADAVYGPNSCITIGHVYQDKDVNGNIEVGGSGLYTSDFRKDGPGSLHINKLTATYDGHTRDLYMDYTGTLTIDELRVEDTVILHYTVGEDANQLNWAVAELEALENGVGLDISEVLSSRGGADKLRNTGICLGITGVEDYSEAQLAALMEKMSLYTDGVGASDETKWGLKKQAGKLWLVVEEFVAGEVDWDSAWSMGNGLRYAPSNGAMNNAVITAADLERIDHYTGSFSDHALALAAAGSEYKTELGQRVIKLTTGGRLMDTKASVIGGLLQAADGAELVMTKADSYILLAPEEGLADEVVRYHLLVGGSSCVSNGGADDEQVGGFTGSSHIQMEGGTVDYIVGGNHVTNRAFAFEGNSFISVMGGNVRGGIVGGSTLTAGSAPSQSDVVEFSGSSYIFIYTALHNDGMPEISAGAGVEGSAFGAIVGGNAWIGLPAGASAEMAPAFRGNSHITIDLAEAAADTFDKDIVGGNYTSFTGEGAANASTEFEGYAEIVINASNDVRFTGSVTGASRRASAGAGHTIFNGNTSVTINGGSYDEAVVGGMRFEETANGEHTAQLGGDTQVTVNEGNLWRVVGGSYSLAGAGGTSNNDAPESEGNASVVINGGFFASHGTEQTELGLVAGGDFYRSTSGSDHLRKGNTSVTINGGSFEGMHIVGGDYVNFEGVVAGNGIATEGSSSVSIAGGSISGGLVVGGTYLTDAGAGGNVSSADTSVSIGEGASISAEKENGHLHQGIAVVAGHVVMDLGTVHGDHSATITGTTTLSVSGGTVEGHLVGGSYVNASDGLNVLDSSAGTVEITLSGGTVKGHVYGGHYSENTDSPDTLKLGEVHITLAGTELTGDIVGGSYRAATAAGTAAAPTQGNITINLVSGALKGNVYAAGRNAGKGTPSATVTENVTVNVGAAVALSAGKTISGGYDKASAGDASAVSGKALLAFTDDAAYTNLNGVNWVEFDTASTVADVTLNGSFKVAAGDKGFTKEGAGMLTLTKGLTAADGSAYTGLLQVNDGILALGKDQALTALGFDLTGRVSRNSVETAYLQAVDGAKLLSGDGDKVRVEITHDSTNGKLRAGYYYLTSELSLDGLDADSEAKEFFDYNEDALKALDTVSSLAANLLLIDKCLVLRVHNDDADTWYWEGGRDGVWSNDDAKDWTRENGSSLAEDSQEDDLTLADVYFNAGAESGDVSIKGTVTPHDIWVESGSFTFSAANSASAGISIVSDGKLIVGTDLVSDPAELTIALNNKHIPHVVLNASGTLTLAARQAINEVKEVEFNGGLLVLAEENGKLLFNTDLSSTVSANSMGKIRLQVGDATPAVARYAAVEVAELKAQWGNIGQTVEENAGVARALSEGIEKSGRGTLEMSWRGNKNASYEGSVDVLDGTLTLAVQGAEGVSTTLEGDAMQVAAGAAVQLVSGGNGTLELARALAGEGSAIIGSEADSAGGAYKLSADNSAFVGDIELLGNSSATAQVNVSQAAALGGKDTTLRLSGRHIRFVDGEAVLKAGTVHVSADSANYVGGTSLNSLNRAAELTGLVEGSGVLANAQGGFHHTLSGDVSGFTGSLVAGAAGVGTAGEQSSWTLSGSTTTAIQAGLAGNGMIDIALTGVKKVTLSGKVGDDKLGSSTDLRNSSAATLILADGGANISTGSLILTEGNGDIQIGVNKSTTGSWSGAVQGKGTLTLVSGSMAAIPMGGDARNVTVVANVAAGAQVNVNGTSGARFHDITVNKGGHLKEVSGTITASAAGVSGATKVKLVLDTLNLGDAPSAHAQDYMVHMAEGGKLHVAESAGFTVDVSNEALFSLLVKFRENEANQNRAYMHLVNNGELSFADGVDVQDVFEDNSTAGILKLLEGFHLSHESDSPGDLVLTGVSTNVYLVVGPDDQKDAKSDERHVTSWTQFDGYVATVVDHDASLHIELGEHHAETGDSITVRNLVGLEDSVLRGTNSMADAGPDNVVTIELNNASVADADIDDTGLSSVGGKTKKDVHGVNTTFLGTIEGGDYVNFAKTGAGTLTVGSAETGHGGLDIAGELALSEGAVHVEGNRAGEGNELGALVFDYEAAAKGNTERGISLSGGTTTVRGIEERGAWVKDNVVRLGEEGELIVNCYDEMTLTGTRFEGEGTLTLDATNMTLDSEGSETERINGVNISVVNNGSLTLTGGTQMKGGSLAAESAGITLSDATVTGASVSLGEGGTLALENGSVLDTQESIELQKGSVATVTAGSQLQADGGLALDGTLDLTNSTGSSITGLSGSGTLRGWVPADDKDRSAAELTVRGSAEQNSFAGTLDGAGTLTVGSGSGLTLEHVTRGRSAGTWNVQNYGELVVNITDSTNTGLGDLHLGGDSTTTIIINTDEKERMGNLDLANLTWESGAKLTVHNDAVGALEKEYLDLGRLSGKLSSGDLDIALTGDAMSHYKSGAVRQENGHWIIDLLEETENKFVSDRMEKNARAGGEMLWEATKNTSANWRRIKENPLAWLVSDLYKLHSKVNSLSDDMEANSAELSRINAAAAGASTSVLGAALAQDMERQLHAVRNRTTAMEAGSNTRSYNLWMNGEGSYHKLSADGFAPGYSLSSWGGTVGMDMNLNANTSVGLALSALYGDLKTDAADSGRGDLDSTYATFFARVAKGPWMHTFLFSGGVADISLNRTVSYGSGAYSTKGSTDGYAVGALYELGYASLMNAEGTFLLQSVFNVELRHASVSGYTETGSDAGLVVDGTSYTTFTVGAGARLQSMVGGSLLNHSALFEARFLVKADVGDRSGKTQNDFINGNNSKRELESAELGAVGIELGAGVTVPVTKRGSVFVDGSVELRSGYSSLNANVGYRVSF